MIADFATGVARFGQRKPNRTAVTGRFVVSMSAGFAGLLGSA